jgi:chromosome segregation ATPase
MPPLPTNVPLWATVLFFVLLWSTRELFGAWMKYRQNKATEMKEESKRKMEERIQDDKRQLEGYKRQLEGYLVLVGDLKARVTHLEEILEAQDHRHDATILEQRQRYEDTTKSLRDEHIACLKAQAEASAKIATLEDEVRSLRTWRHDLANQANVVALKAVADELKINPEAKAKLKAEVEAQGKKKE